MKIHQTFLLSIGFLFGSALFAQSTALLNDSFASAPTASVTITASNSTSLMGQNLTAAQAAALAIPTTGPTAQWFPNGATSSGGNGLVYTNALSSVTTGTLLIPAAASESVQAFFMSPGSYQTLTGGDALTLAFNFTLGINNPQNNSSALKFGLFNSGSATGASNSNQSTRSTGNNGSGTLPNQPTLYTGYYCAVNPNQNSSTAASVLTLFSRAANATTTYISSTTNFANLGNSSAASTSFTNILSNGTTNAHTYQAVLTVYFPSSSSTTMTVMGNVFDTNVSTTTPMTSYTLTEPATQLVTSFDGLVIADNFNTTADPQTLTNVSVTYIQNAVLPYFNPGAGTYLSAQSVSINSIFTGLSFAYTTDGTTPTESGGTVTHGTQYTTPIAVNANTTLKTISFTSGTGGSDSAVVSADYVINLNGVSAPVFSPAAGTYSSTQSVSITSITSGASIAYTTDGSTPTESGSVVTHGTSYSGPVSIAATTTLKAIAFKTGNDSSVTSGIYTISAAAPTPDAPPLPYSGPGGGAFDDWFLALLALAGLLRWRQTRR